MGTNGSGWQEIERYVEFRESNSKSSTFLSYYELITFENNEHLNAPVLPFTSQLLIFDQKCLCSSEHDIAILPGMAKNNFDPSKSGLMWLIICHFFVTVTVLLQLSFSVLSNWKWGAVVFKRGPQPHSSIQSLFCLLSFCSLAAYYCCLMSSKSLTFLPCAFPSTFPFLSPSLSHVSVDS